jgi:hypothetical protein
MSQEDGGRSESRSVVPEPIVGKISVEQNPLPAGGDSLLTLRWESSGETAELCVSEDGSPDKLVARSASGELHLEWIRPGITYLFRLYSITEPRKLIDDAKFYWPVAGRIRAQPNPIPLEAGSRTTLQWEITSPAAAEITLLEPRCVEKVVCRGRSGSFEVSGLRAGVTYFFRLYPVDGPRELLDEVSVQLTDIPWAALRERIKSGSTNPVYFDQLTRLIGEVMPHCLHEKDFPKWFRSWEADGFHVTPVHFYEPIPDTRTLNQEIWERPPTVPGVEMNEAGQRQLLCDAFPAFAPEYNQIPLEAPATGVSFYLQNGRFERLDSLIAYCMVRHYQPRRIIEVGSGYSTLLLAQAAGKNGSTELHSIEPYPVEFLTKGIAGLTSLMVKKVEEVDTSIFSSLNPGDFLFIDTSHVVRIGGDVNYLFLEVLPRLQPGVIVHVHDIFLPLEYPREWVIERRRFWTEQYLLQAFLTYNSEFEVLISSGYLKAQFPEELKSVFPTAAPWQGGSFWMRRKPNPSP